MDKEELEEVYQRLIARHAPESSAGHALIFVKQVLTAESMEEAAEPLFNLIHLLSTVGERERFMVLFCAKLLPFACTEAGGKVFAEMAARMEAGEG